MGDDPLKGLKVEVRDKKPFYETDSWKVRVAREVAYLQSKNRNFAQCIRCGQPYPGKDIVGVSSCGMCGFKKPPESL